MAWNEPLARVVGVPPGVPWDGGVRTLGLVMPEITDPAELAMPVVPVLEELEDPELEVMDGVPAETMDGGPCLG